MTLSRHRLAHTPNPVWVYHSPKLCSGRRSARGRRIIDRAFSAFRSSRRKEESHSEPAAKTMGTGIRRIGPIAHPADDADPLLLNLGNLGDHEVDRCHPFAGLPVVGAFTLEGKRPGLWRRIGD